MPSLTIDTVQDGGSTNEQQTITLTNASGGTFTLTFGTDPDWTPSQLIQPGFGTWGNIVFHPTGGLARSCTTNAIAYDATAATVQAALESLPSIGVGQVSVSGPAGGPWAVEFTGTLGATDVDMIVGNGDNLLTSPAEHNVDVKTIVTGHSGWDEVWSLTYETVSPVDPTWLTIDVEVLDPIGGGGPAETAQWNRSWTAVQIETALDTALQNFHATYAVSVSKVVNGTTVTVTITPGSGNLMGVDWDDTWISPDDLANPGYQPDLTLTETQQGGDINEQQTVTIGNQSTVGGGTFTLTYSGQTTAAIDWDASAADVDTALEALSNIGAGDVSVSGSAGGPWTVEFTGALAGTNVAQMTGNGNSLTGSAVGVAETVQGYAVRDEIQSVDVSGANGGTFTLTYSGQTTAAIDWNATPAAVQSALQALPSIGSGNLTVGGSVGSWLATFTGTLAGTNVAQMTGSGANLTWTASTEYRQFKMNSPGCRVQWCCQCVYEDNMDNWEIVSGNWTEVSNGTIWLETTDSDAEAMSIAAPEPGYRIFDLAMDNVGHSGDGDVIRVGFRDEAGDNRIYAEITFLTGPQRTKVDIYSVTSGGAPVLLDTNTYTGHTTWMENAFLMYDPDYERFSGHLDIADSHWKVSTSLDLRHPYIATGTLVSGDTLQFGKPIVNSDGMEHRWCIRPWFQLPEDYYIARGPFDWRIVVSGVAIGLADQEWGDCYEWVMGPLPPSRVAKVPWWNEYNGTFVPRHWCFVDSPSCSSEEVAPWQYAEEWEDTVSGTHNCTGDDTPWSFDIEVKTVWKVNVIQDSPDGDTVLWVILEIYEKWSGAWELQCDLEWSKTLAGLPDLRALTDIDMGTPTDDAGSTCGNNYVDWSGSQLLLTAVP